MNTQLPGAVTPPSMPLRTSIPKRVAWIVMTALALMMALIASRYLFGGPDV